MVPMDLNTAQGKIKKLKAMSSSSRVTKTMAPIGAGMRPRAYVNISYDHASPGPRLRGERAVAVGWKWKSTSFLHTTSY